jgi:hypothetical protein
MFLAGPIRLFRSYPGFTVHDELGLFVESGLTPALGALATERKISVHTAFGRFIIILI